VTTVFGAIEPRAASIGWGQVWSNMFLSQCVLCYICSSVTCSGI